jgi:hypothetical protein
LQIWQWTSGQTAFFVNLTSQGVDIQSPQCAYYNFEYRRITIIYCHESTPGDFRQSQDFPLEFVCEFDKPKLINSDDAFDENSNSNSSNLSVATEELNAKAGVLSELNAEYVTWNTSVVICPAGHVTRDFLACDVQSGCAEDDHAESCSGGGRNAGGKGGVVGGEPALDLASVQVPMFRCRRNGIALPYTLVCDHSQHCSDNSDEDFCVFEACLPNSYQCRNGQCLNRNKFCDGLPDCSDGSDENCQRSIVRRLQRAVPLPTVVTLNGRGNYSLTPLNTSDGLCPWTHFYCREGACLPAYLRCNGVPDCIGLEDEEDCEDFIW